MSSRSSILSPGRAGSIRNQPVPSTLTTSLSRRLKHSRSIKGGASPAMFPTPGKKRGCGFDNPEPSSPKVTCIGQVRVKSKKKHAKNVNSLRKFDHSRSQRQRFENSNGINNGNNQKWVHIPLTICEALRTFGSEVSCLFPCRSSCSSNTSLENKEKDEGVDRQGSCGAVVARWLVALQDGDGGGDRRDMELVGGRDVDGDVDGGYVRRHVFQDLEIVDDSIMGSMDEGRVSICVPPKNALLLMRCRSDPLMMEALANRFWEPSYDINDEEDDEFVDSEEEIEENEVHEEDFWVEKEKKVMALGEIMNQECEGSEEIVEIEEEEVKQSVPEENVEMNLEMEAKQSVLEDNVEMNLEIKKKECDLEENDQEQSLEINEEEERFYLDTLFDEIEHQEIEDQEVEEEEGEDDDMEDAQEELYEDIQENETGESNIEKVKVFEEEYQNMVTEFFPDDESHEEIVMESEIIENEVLEEENEKKDTNTSKPMPECLLLMMYEPKLSMEVSKETWVCSSDFIRRRSNKKKPPQPPPQPTQTLVESIEGQQESKVKASSSPSDVTTKEHDNHVMKMNAVQSEPGLHQPARSSYSFPTRPSVLEQKLVNTMGYEPLVLTRCNSEPMRTAAAKLKPDACYWKNKLEPPRRASFGIGMAGLGF
ncbi:uncharacterized protein [Rutidosis leptorrhynchoides]|uniref:uncharacterized protein n=1 Tax=Rutidosis leptorrhynchoides TaxID=125765 RepID=UPI003A99848F